MASDLLDVEHVFRGGGEMGALVRSIDWSKTAVGVVSSWPQSLRTAVGILLESKFAMMLAWGRELTHFYNDAYRPILGSSKHPTLGAPVPVVFRESWHAVIAPLFEKVLLGEAVRFDDLMVPLDRDGYLEECYFTFSYAPVRDEKGAVAGVQVTVFETTARVIAERRLRILRDLAENASQATSEATAWSRVAETLREQPTMRELAFALLYQISPDGDRASGSWSATRVDSTVLPEAMAPMELEPNTPASPWPVASAIAMNAPELVANVRQRFGDVTNSIWLEPIEQALVLPIRRPGLSRPYGVLIAGLSARRRLDDAYRDFLALAADQVATVIANARALDDEARRGEALAQLDRQKTAFFSSISHEFRTPPAFLCIILKGPQHVLQLMNPPYSALIGGRDVLGMPIREALPEVTGQGYFDPLDEVYRTGEPYFGNDGRVLLDRAGDGELQERYVNLIYLPSRDRSGDIDGVIVFGFDVTDEVIARRRLERDRLTADEAHAKAESAIRSRDEFLTVASHELRTPLTTLGLQIDGLLRSMRQSLDASPTPQRWLDKAERLREQADRLEELIEGMFEVFSLSRERVELNYEDVDLAVVARTVIDRLRASSKQASTRFELVTEPAVGRWDRTRLERVLSQLLSNALKFGAGKAISVRVEVHGASARLSVVDRGIGIASEHHDRIFERFERATSASHYAGFGLGLWLVRQLVTAMHGTVRVESAPGRGSTFIVDLPRNA